MCSLFPSFMCVNKYTDRTFFHFGDHSRWLTITKNDLCKTILYENESTGVQKCLNVYFASNPYYRDTIWNMKIKCSFNITISSQNFPWFHRIYIEFTHIFGPYCIDWIYLIVFWMWTRNYKTIGKQKLHIRAYTHIICTLVAQKSW